MEIDAHVNQMRRELQLPERLRFYPGIFVKQAYGGVIVHARLLFVELAMANANTSSKQNTR